MVPRPQGATVDGETVAGVDKGKVGAMSCSGLKPRAPAGSHGRNIWTDRRIYVPKKERKCRARLPDFFYKDTTYASAIGSGG